MNIIETTIIKPGYRSDHSIVELTLNLSKHKKGQACENLTTLSN
jgi:hypothetical protein